MRSNARADVEKRRSEWAARVEAELARMVEVLRHFPGIRRVIVFGSVGRVECRWRSDLDLVVVQETSLRPVERIEGLLHVLRPSVPTDLLVYPPPEWRSPEMASFVRRVEREGRVVYAADE